MNKNIIIGAVVLLVLGIGAYFVMNKKSPSSKTATSTQTSSPKSLKDLLTAGIAQKCTFAEGTVYLAGGKMRGDFSSSASGQTVKSHMITDSTNSYIWMDDQPQGFKFAITAEDKANAQSPVDVNKPGDYNCGPWVTDGSFFTPPVNIQFSDMNSLTVPAVPSY